MPLISPDNYTLYLDYMSQPSRALAIFCRAAGLSPSLVKEQPVLIHKRQQLTPEFLAKNPLGKLPLLEHTSEAGTDEKTFRLPESIAILSYLTTVYSHLQRKVPDHWYPHSDPMQRARVEAALHWYHTSIRHGCAQLVWHKAIAALVGMEGDEAQAQAGLVHLKACLPHLESVWLTGPGPYMCGNSLPSVADIMFCCELEQLTLLNKGKHGVDMGSLLEPHPRIRLWMQTVARALAPHYEQVHTMLRKVALTTGGTLSPAQEPPVARM